MSVCVCVCSNRKTHNLTKFHQLLVWFPRKPKRTKAVTIWQTHIHSINSYQIKNPTKIQSSRFQFSIHTHQAKQQNIIKNEENTTSIYIYTQTYTHLKAESKQELQENIKQERNKNAKKKTHIFCGRISWCQRDKKEKWRLLWREKRGKSKGWWLESPSAHFYTSLAAFWGASGPDTSV